MNKVAEKNNINKIINVTLCVILFIVPLLITPRKVYSIPYNILKICVLLLCGLILLICLILKRKELKFDLIDKTLIAFYILIVISTFFSIDIPKSIWGENNRYEGLLTFTVYFLTYYCAKYYFAYDKKLKIFAIITVCITSIIAIMQYYNIFPLYYLYDALNIPYSSGFASSTFGNSNFLGSFLSIAVTIFMALYITKGNKSYLMVSYLSFYALIVGMARSSWVGLGIASIFGIIYVIKNRNKEIIKKACYITIGFVMIFVWILNAPELITNNLPYYSKEMSLENRIKLINDEITFAVENKELKDTFGSGRIEIWRMVLKTIAMHPIIGSGPDTLARSLLINVPNDAMNYIERTNTYADKAHNEYLQIAATIGIPALIVYLAFLAQLLSKQKDMFRNNASFIFIIPIIAYLAQAFFNISTIGVAPIFWFLLGLIQNEKFKNVLLQAKLLKDKN